MKRKILMVILVIAIVLAIAAGIKLMRNDQNSNHDFEAYAGVYYFDYQQDSADLIEDHYIVIETYEGKLRGYYYGTSDDFDHAREGYAPGFFVAQMKDLNIVNGTIRFDIQLFSRDIFSAPVDLSYKQSDTVSVESNAPWLNAQIFSAENGIMNNYQGTIENEEIILKINDESRVFKKQN